MDCLGSSDLFCRIVEQPFPLYTDSVRDGKMKETRETSRVNWSKAIGGWNVCYFSVTLSEVFSFHPAVVIKTSRLFLQLLQRAKKTFEYFLYTHRSIILPKGMHRSNFFSPDTTSNTSTQSICQYQAPNQYRCSLFPKFKICTPHSVETLNFIMTFTRKLYLMWLGQVHLQ